MKLDQIPLLSPSPGTKRFLQVYRLGPIDAKQKVYIQAGLHADEWPGLLVIQHLLPKLEQLESAGQLNAQFVVVPYANPVGMDQQLFGAHTGRYFHENGQNFNRKMSLSTDRLENLLEGRLTDSTETNTQLIREALQELVRNLPDENEIQVLHKTLLTLSIDADYVFDLHCDLVSLPHIFCGNTQVDATIELAEAISFPVVLHEDELGEVAFDGTHLQPWVAMKKRFPKFPIQTACLPVTIELRGKMDVNDQLALQDALNLVSYFRAKELIQSEVTPEARAASNQTLIDPIKVQSFPLEQVQVVKSPVQGILIYHRTIGSRVKAGEVIAEIVLLDSDEPNSRAPIKSLVDGFLFSQTHVTLVRPGSTIAMIGGDKVLNNSGYQLAD